MLIQQIHRYDNDVLDALQLLWTNVRSRQCLFNSDVNLLLFQGGRITYLCSSAAAAQYHGIGQFVVPA